MTESSSHRVTIPAGDVVLDADLTVPVRAVGIVVFAHGSGSSRFSPRNRSVAEGLQAGGLATLLLDLLTPDEARVDDVTRELRFDVERLAERLVHACRWVGERPDIASLPVGLFGASTGAAAALLAAARHAGPVRAIVSRGGRPDLAGEALSSVQAPTLLIVGERDPDVLELNREAQRHLPLASRLAVVAGAGHLFEEAGALDDVTRLARDWFVDHMHPRRGADERGPA